VPREPSLSPSTNGRIEVESHLTRPLFPQIVAHVKGLAWHTHPGRGGGGVSEKDTWSSHSYKDGAANGTCACEMMSVNVAKGMNELSDGVICPFQRHEGGKTCRHIGDPV